MPIPSENEEYTKNADWSSIPQHGRQGLQLYIESGIPPGSFLEAIICNDLVEACGRADDINRRHLYDYVAFLYQYAPAICWKSPQAYTDWIKRGGWAGVMKQDDMLKTMIQESQEIE